jgi:hypothetical protein
MTGYWECELEDNKAFGDHTHNAQCKYHNLEGMRMAYEPHHVVRTCFDNPFGQGNEKLRTDMNVEDHTQVKYSGIQGSIPNLRERAKDPAYSIFTRTDTYRSGPKKGLRWKQVEDRKWVLGTKLLNFIPAGNIWANLGETGDYEDIWYPFKTEESSMFVKGCKRFEVRNNPLLYMDAEAPNGEGSYGIMSNKNVLWELMQQCVNSLGIGSFVANPAGKIVLEWYKGMYLTSRGVQMATAISIGMLYSYNIVADAWSVKKCRDLGIRPGKSLVAGDDSLRAGNDTYINEYRLAIEVMGGQFSKTKDVVGRYPRGVFTEILFEGHTIKDVPKTKTLVRPKDDNRSAPAWLRAVPAIKSLKAPLEGLRIPLRQEIISRYGELSNPDLPLALPVILGGLGDLGPVPSAPTAAVLKNISQIKDPIDALEALRTLTKCISVQTEPERIIKLKVSAQSGIKPVLFNDPTQKVVRDKLYHDGKLIYYRLAAQRVKGLVETASLLEMPPKPVRFKKNHGTESFAARKCINKTMQFLAEKDLVNPWLFDHRTRTMEVQNGKAVYSNPNLGPARSWQHFTANNYNADVSIDYLKRYQLVAPHNLTPEDAGTSDLELRGEQSNQDDVRLSLT